MTNSVHVAQEQWLDVFEENDVNKSYGNFYILNIGALRYMIVNSHHL
jgi:hypothetical protein